MRSVNREYWIEKDKMGAYYYWNATVEIDTDGDMIECSVDGPVTVCPLDSEDEQQVEFDSLPVDLRQTLEDHMFYTTIGW